MQKAGNNSLPWTPKSKPWKYVGSITGLSKAELLNKWHMIEKIYCSKYVLSQPVTLSINLWSTYFKNMP